MIRNIHTNPMKLFSRILLTLVAASLPLNASAAVPESVRGIEAEMVDGVVSVQWDGVPNATSYRIFYSHTSILDNDGLYDDFETVSGTTSHVLQNITPSADLYISVLAVNGVGEESPYFVEEAHVALGDTFMQPQTSSAASSMAATTEPYGQNDVIVEDGMTFLRLLSAESISSTGVLLTFSHPVVVAPEQATLAFGILTSSGSPLALQRLVLQGTTVPI